MKILRILAVAVASVAISSSAHGAGFGCGMTSCAGGYDCNFADSLWAGYQPTEPIYIPTCEPCCGGGCMFPRLAAKFQGGGCATPVCAAPCNPCCDSGGWYHFAGSGDCCGLGGGCIGSRIGMMFGKLRGQHCTDACESCFPHTGFDIGFGCTSGCTSGSGEGTGAGCPAGGCAGNDAAPAVESQAAPSGDSPVIESRPAETNTDPAAPPMIEQGTSFPPASGGPFDSTIELHETAPPATRETAPAGQPAELLPPADDQDEAVRDQV